MNAMEWIMTYRNLGLALVAALAVAGCSRSFVGGAAVGAGTAGVAYEVYNKEKLDDIEDDYRAGRIDREEYQRRRDEVGDRSLVY